MGIVNIFNLECVQQKWFKFIIQVCNDSIYKTIEVSFLRNFSLYLFPVLQFFGCLSFLSLYYSISFYWTLFLKILLSTRIWIHQNNDFKKATCVHVDYYLWNWKWWRTWIVQKKLKIDEDAVVILFAKIKIFSYETFFFPQFEKLITSKKRVFILWFSTLARCFPSLSFGYIRCWVSFFPFRFQTQFC